MTKKILNLKNFSSKIKLFNKIYTDLSRLLKKNDQIIISGGKSIRPMYSYLNSKKLKNTQIIISDERIVPHKSSLSNYGYLKKKINDPNRIIWPNKEFYTYKKYKKKNIRVKYMNEIFYLIIYILVSALYQ